jgi:hypothetical protein
MMNILEKQSGMNIVGHGGKTSLSLMATRFCGGWWS